MYIYTDIYFSNLKQSLQRTVKRLLCDSLSYGESICCSGEEYDVTSGALLLGCRAAEA